MLLSVPRADGSGDSDACLFEATCLPCGLEFRKSSSGLQRNRPTASDMRVVGSDCSGGVRAFQSRADMGTLPEVDFLPDDREMAMIGARLRRLRKEHGFTLRQVADAVDITERALAKIEKNEAVPGGDTWAKLADYFGVKMDDLREPRDPVGSESPGQLVARLTAAAQTAQTAVDKTERQMALSEMRRLYAVLAQSEVERVDTERSSAASAKKSRKK